MKLRQGVFSQRMTWRKNVAFEQLLGAELIRLRQTKFTASHLKDKIYKTWLGRLDG